MQLIEFLPNEVIRKALRNDYFPKPNGWDYTNRYRIVSNECKKNFELYCFASIHRHIREVPSATHIHLIFPKCSNKELKTQWIKMLKNLDLGMELSDEKAIIPLSMDSLRMNLCLCLARNVYEDKTSAYRMLKLMDIGYCAAAAYCIAFSFAENSNHNFAWEINDNNTKIMLAIHKLITTKNEFIIRGMVKYNTQAIIGHYSYLNIRCVERGLVFNDPKTFNLALDSGDLSLLYKVNK